MTPDKFDRMDEKRRLRREMIARRDALPEAYVAAADQSIREQVLSLPAYARAKSVFLYVSVPGEPDTRVILEQALSVGKRVYVPKCRDKGTMLAVRIRDVSDLAPGAYGIPEPVSWEETAPAKDLDLILVPCVAASRRGDRLGHGAGYYDRFLACGGEKAVCLCYEKMLCDHIPVEPTDVVLPLVIWDHLSKENA